jgi:polyvinyl alcohol dehydrogenase (cytochrome)
VRLRLSLTRRAVALALGPLVLFGSSAVAATGAGCPDPDWSSFGRGAARTFSVPAGCSSIDTSSVSTLVPAWFLHTTDSVTASPSVWNGTAYVGSWDGTFYAIDVASGAVRWTFQVRSHAPTAFGRIVSSATIQSFPEKGGDRDVVLFGGGSSVWALDAKTGTELATIDLDPRTPALRAQQESGDNPPVVEVESSPAVAMVNGVRRIYVGLDVHNDAHVGRTGLVALELQPSKAGWRFSPLWKLDAETSQTYHGAAGLTTGSGEGWGCGGVWSSPAVDEETGTVVFGTASCSHPAETYDAGENYGESMVAADAVTGKLRWRYRPADDLPGRDARIADPERDADFGATPNLFRLHGRLVVGEGRKSADYYVRDLLTGEAVHTSDVGQEGFANSGFGIGGFLGTPAVQAGPDGSATVVGATAIPIPRSPEDLDPATWGVRAFDPATGEIAWTYRLAGPSYGHTSLVNGVALVPDTTNSALVALDVASGLPLWEAPVVGPPSSTAVVAGDTVLVSTGTRETDLEYKAFSTDLQDALGSVTGASPLSPLSGVQAFKVP